MGFHYILNPLAYTYDLKYTNRPLGNSEYHKIEFLISQIKNTL